MTEPREHQRNTQSVALHNRRNSPAVRSALIVSGHPLFSAGLRSLLEQRRAAQMPGYINIQVAATVQRVEDAITALNTLRPDLIIVDFDLYEVSRTEFLTRFVESDISVRLVLASLDESGSITVYDRHKYTLTEADDWLSTITALAANTGMDQIHAD